MSVTASPIEELRARYRQGDADPVAVVDAALTRANSNAGSNVYLARDEAWSRTEAAKLRREDLERQPLWGVPVSLKDCFDLAGFPTSCGSAFYRERNGVAERDSAVAERLRAAGAVITGKTHLHQLAYGITGENKDFGDCLQPRDAGLLTGGSSSGAAASVQEGSALAAIGTDTGGSVRAPAALCGLAGYRASVTLGDGLWRGGAHLAATFDTIGWLYRDLRDGPLLAEALLGVPRVDSPQIAGLRIGLPPRAFLHDCEKDVLRGMQTWAQELEARGTSFAAFDATFWVEAMEIFAPIQASEAAEIHRGNFQHFEPAIAERLAWGASISADEVEGLRERLVGFRARMSALFDACDYLLLPCCPMAELRAGEDQSETRMRVLRYTMPMSLAGTPVVTLPARVGGMQLVGRVGGDAELLALSAALVETGAV